MSDMFQKAALDSLLEEFRHSEPPTVSFIVQCIFTQACLEGDKSDSIGEKVTTSEEELNCNEGLDENPIGENNDTVVDESSVIEAKIEDNFEGQIDNVEYFLEGLAVVIKDMESEIEVLVSHNVNTCLKLIYVFEGDPRALGMEMSVVLIAQQTLGYLQRGAEEVKSIETALASKSSEFQMVKTIKRNINTTIQALEDCIALMDHYLDVKDYLHLACPDMVSTKIDYAIRSLNETYFPNCRQFHFVSLLERDIDSLREIVLHKFRSKLHDFLESSLTFAYPVGLHALNCRHESKLQDFSKDSLFENDTKSHSLDSGISSTCTKTLKNGVVLQEKQIEKFHKSALDNTIIECISTGFTDIENRSFFNSDSDDQDDSSSVVSCGKSSLYSNDSFSNTIMKFISNSLSSHNTEDPLYNIDFTTAIGAFQIATLFHCDDKFESHYLEQLNFQVTMITNRFEQGKQGLNDMMVNIVGFFLIQEQLFGLQDLNTGRLKRVWETAAEKIEGCAKARAEWSNCDFTLLSKQIIAVTHLMKGHFFDCQKLPALLPSIFVTFSTNLSHKWESRFLAIFSAETFELTSIDSREDFEPYVKYASEDVPDSFPTFLTYSNWVVSVLELIHNFNEILTEHLLTCGMAATEEQMLLAATDYLVCKVFTSCLSDAVSKGNCKEPITILKARQLNFDLTFFQAALSKQLLMSPSKCHDVNLFVDLINSLTEILTCDLTKTLQDLLNIEYVMTLSIEQQCDVIVIKVAEALGSIEPPLLTLLTTSSQLVSELADIVVSFMYNFINNIFHTFVSISRSLLMRIEEVIDDYILAFSSIFQNETAASQTNTRFSSISQTIRIITRNKFVEFQRFLTSGAKTLDEFQAVNIALLLNLVDKIQKNEKKGNLTKEEKIRKNTLQDFQKFLKKYKPIK